MVEVTPDQWKSLDGTVEKSASKDEPDLQDWNVELCKMETLPRSRHSLGLGLVPEKSDSSGSGEVFAFTIGARSLTGRR